MRSGVHDRLGALSPHRHDQQVADHGRLAFLVEVTTALWPAPSAPCPPSHGAFHDALRAAMIAPACWRCSMAAAISGA
jgi:hypothetical protein